MNAATVAQNPDGQAHRSAHDEKIEFLRKISRRSISAPSSRSRDRIFPLYHSPQRLRQSQSWALDVFVTQFQADLALTLNLLRVSLVVIRIPSFCGTIMFQCLLPCHFHRRCPPCPSPETCKRSSPTPLPRRLCRWLDKLRANFRPQAVVPMYRLPHWYQCRCVEFPPLTLEASIHPLLLPWSHPGRSHCRKWEPPSSSPARLSSTHRASPRRSCPPSCLRQLAQWPAI